jgi:hypothetical protein
MNYLPPAEVSRPVPLPTIRERARRCGYLISADHCTGTFSLVDARLHLPLLGLDHVTLPEIARAVEAVRAMAEFAMLERKIARSAKVMRAQA